jgi:hypothetical protein
MKGLYTLQSGKKSIKMQTLAGLSHGPKTAQTGKMPSQPDQVGG